MIRRSIVGFFFLAYALLTSPSHAIGLATGPSLGMSGFYTSFDLSQQARKITTNHLAFQLGLFAKLDLWLLYSKLDAAFVLDSRALPNNSDRELFKYITIPFTMGLPCFGMLRPHIGVIFRINLDDLNDTKFTSNALVEGYKEKINGYLVGLGIDLGNFLVDIDWEFACSKIDKRTISALIEDGNDQYRPKQLGLRFAYNLLANLY